MKRVLLALAVLATGCAHGGVTSTGAAGLAGKPHAPLGLDALVGVDEQQDPVLESTLCQSLVELNHGDVECPSSRRATRELARTRAMINAADTAVPENLTQQTPHHVTATLSHAGTDFVLKLDYFDAADGASKASAQVTASSFDELVQKAPDAAKALLQ